MYMSFCQLCWLGAGFSAGYENCDRTLTCSPCSPGQGKGAPHLCASTWTSLWQHWMVRTSALSSSLVHKFTFLLSSAGWATHCASRLPEFSHGLCLTTPTSQDLALKVLTAPPLRLQCQSEPPLGPLNCLYVPFHLVLPRGVLSQIGKKNSSYYSQQIQSLT